ncbi:hypothetical protein CC85DRAFT_303946 [Cutaneotrichosporon oleaginosum]|uniref:Uncharacterized protein n=1 Tax=Cutaneotrichosporon oleaginosum TaxID=879819 RepID=A0A0J1AZ72_9TREE|nr:uncharacterized protein CC85DRAFT_303946 [Cutaneotrichosporon oleaginosum]KLT40639.1 hypothetical protein CC85DRAFT_303946 [Cutaneotrichosporon oleaginosum]
MSTASSSARGSVRGKSAPRDELDRLGYIYTLRVAALQHRLKTPSAASPKITLGPAAIIGTFPSSPSVSMGEMTPKSPGFGSFRSPEPVDLPLPMRRKRSVLSLRLGRKDELKLPREFLAEFWGVLSAESGDMGWTQAVRTFLGMLKKGTKTAGGANMREIPTLCATFTSCLPPPGLGSAPPAQHQSHFLTLLYNTLPTSTFFAAPDEDGRDLLFRLRAEIQSLLHGPGSPTATLSPTSAQFSPQLAAQGIAAKAGLGIYPASPASPTSTLNPMTPTSPIPPTSPRRATRPASDAGSVRRKPIPMWTGSGEGLDNMVEAVGVIWDVPQDALEQDADELDRFVLEKLYLDHLKRELSLISRQSADMRRSRHVELSKELGDLMAGFPELAIPTSPAAFGQQQESFFKPPRSAAVFARLVRRAEASSSRRALELVDRCRKVWGVEKREAKERDVETALRQWDAAIGSSDEMPLARRLADVTSILAAVLDPDEDVPRPLEEVQNCLMEHLTNAVHEVFPLSADTQPALPPSLVMVFQSAPSVLLHHPRALEMLDRLADELRGHAVAEYVTASMELMGDAHAQVIGSTTGESGKDAVVEGFERVAAWIESEIKSVEKAWPRNGPIDPAAIIASKQLPLFLAELQVFETAVGAADVFGVFEATHHLLQAWERLCPGVSDFDVDTFFEPHVRAWLRETEATETHQWVARTISMDQWQPEGEGRHSQSVVDLFEFLREATMVVRNLPVKEHKRAIYMVDLARMASAALELYASTISDQFRAEIAPPKTTSDAAVLNNKWMTKGKFAYGKLDAKIDALDRRRRGRTGFVVQPAALVKLTNLGAAGSFIDDLVHALEAEQTASVLGPSVTAASARQVFSVQVVRGQGLLTRSLKPADAFVAVLDGPVRLFKSRTVLSAEDPAWAQAFEVSIAAAKPLEVIVYDRQLVGKHERLGGATFTLDPAHFTSEAEREVVILLSSRASVTLRISSVGRERNDVAYHLNSSRRVLKRTAGDMQLALVERLAEYLREVLSPSTLSNVTKLVRARKRVALSDADIETSLAPVLEYLDENLAALSATCTPTMRETLALALWERLVDHLLSLLVPPLSDRPAPPGLSPPEVDAVFKWLQALKTFFAVGIPISALQSGSYRDMLLLGQVLDLPTPALRERAAAAVRATSGGAPLRHNPPKSSRARIQADNARVAELLLRVVRLRTLDDDFLPTQLAALTGARAS